MAQKAHKSVPDRVPRWYRGPDVPMSVIRRFARDVAKQFHPEKIVLFGSHAYGQPHQDSDVDILVVMPARNAIDQAIKIGRVTEPQFPLDLIVRTPKDIAWRLKEGDSFLREVMAQGKVLYEEAHRRMGAKGGVRFRRSKKTGPRSRAAS
jgi:predicted nucleotidyltransferase